MPRTKKEQSKSRQPKRVRVDPQMSGNGSYNLNNGPWAKRGATVGALVGGKFGGPIGSVVGSYLGRRMFHYPAKLFGSGDYRTSQPLVSTGSNNRISPPVPKFTMDKDGVCIAHTEYIGDIITSSTPGGLKIQKFAINPAEPATFPWLASIAQQSFQQYKFEGCAFQFKSYSADALNSVNTALGAFFTCINYDFTDADFTSRSQIENSSWAQACKPSDDVLIPVECKPSNTSMNGFLYVQNGFGMPADADPRLYNLGKLFIGTTGFQGASVNIGSLYVTYKIRLFKPVIPAPLSNAHIVNIIRTATGPTNPFGLGYNTTQFSADTIGLSFNSSGTRMTFSRSRLVPDMRFTIVLLWYGTSAVIVHPSITQSGMLSLGAFDTWTRDTIYMPQNGTNMPQSSITKEVVITQGNDDPYIELDTLGVYPTAGYMQVYIIQRNGLGTEDIGIYTPL